MITLLAFALTGCGGTAAPDAAAPPSPDAPFEGVQVVPLEQLDFTDQLHALAGDSPDNGGLALDGELTSLRLHWYGDVPAEVLALIAAYEDTLPEQVVPSPLRPGDLREEAGRLVRERAPVVRGAGPRIEGDGVTVVVPTAAVGAPGPVS